MSTQKVTDPLIEAISSSVLTGALPVIDGSALTGISGFVNTTNASDPASNTNPGTGVGTVWTNSTSGEIFICTDATTDANVWTNVGAGTGDIQAKSSEQGTISGYCSGGYTGSNVNTIDKYSFATDGNGTDVGNLTTNNRAPAGQSSSTHGYTSGGGGYGSTVSKFSFTTDGNANNVSTLSGSREDCTGQSSTTHGYTSAGGYPSTTKIDKMSFATEAQASHIANLSLDRTDVGSCVSTTHGYTMGGYNTGQPGARADRIDKFPFASDSDATNVGSLSIGRSGVNGQNSYTDGYATGGYASPPGSQVNRIDKWSFASDGTASDVADLSEARGTAAGQSSVTYGYTACGQTPSKVNTIDKFPFASDTNATDVGDMTQGREGVAGHQY